VLRKKIKNIWRIAAEKRFTISHLPVKVKNIFSIDIFNVVVVEFTVELFGPASIKKRLLYMDSGGDKLKRENAAQVKISPDRFRENETQHS
jgi:hypothetical protein